MPIELAPHHKFGLVLPSSVMPASGIFGYGDLYRDLVDVGALGAMVTHPVSFRPRRASRGQRVAVHGENVLIHTGWPNPGLRRVIRRYGRLWSRFPVPVIVHLLATTPSEVGKAADRLSALEGVAGIELGLAEDTKLQACLELLNAAQFDGALPIIVKIPHGRVDELALPLEDAGADALTLTAPPRAVLPRFEDEEMLPSKFIRGRLYGPARFPQLLHVLTVWGSRLSVPLIACGGVATPQEALACLSLGAEAVQIEACVWRNPSILNTIARALAQPVMPPEDSPFLST